jgi:DNA repair protein RadC
LEKIVMNNSSKSQTPLRVVLTRVGEASLTHYGAARTPINTPENAFVFWRDVVSQDASFEADKEHLIAIMHDTKHRPICYHVVSVGSLNEAVAHPREIFRAAVVASAYGIILMHNHPSGDPAPSEADKRLTRRINECGELLRICLTDHIIAGTAEGGRQPHFSFRENGMI